MTVNRSDSLIVANATPLLSSLSIEHAFIQRRSRPGRRSRLTYPAAALQGRSLAAREPRISATSAGRLKFGQCPAGISTTSGPRPKNAGAIASGIRSSVPRTRVDGSSRQAAPVRGWVPPAMFIGLSRYLIDEIAAAGNIRGSPQHPGRRRRRPGALGAPDPPRFRHRRGLRGGGRGALHLDRLPPPHRLASRGGRAGQVGLSADGS